MCFAVLVTRTFVVVSLAICQHVLFKTWSLVPTQKQSFTLNHLSVKQAPEDLVFVRKITAEIVTAPAVRQRFSQICIAGHTH